MLNSIASDPNDSRGRLFSGQESQNRTLFQRDRDRIIHSTAFRRLKHKTQVFVAHEGDHFRTRLTHTIEVGQVARTIAKALGLNIELTEAVALAHDLGHTPFGHVGEEVLHKNMEGYGGFDHNAQAIKIVTSLEKNYAEFDGLNLTWETLEGIAKHNGPVTSVLPYALKDYNSHQDLELHTYASAEAQVAAIADDVAYNNHDIDDGLRAGLFSESDISQIEVIGECFSEVDKIYPNLNQNRRRHEALRRVFGIMVDDVIETSKGLIEKSGATHSQDIRDLKTSVVQFSEKLSINIKDLRSFLYENMYRSDRVNEMREQSKAVVDGLFDGLMNNPSLLPDSWAKNFQSDTQKARAISDYIAGMTDGYAIKRHEAL